MISRTLFLKMIALVLVLATAVGTTPVTAAEFSGAPAAVGSITTAGRVLLRTVPVSREGTVFSGDRIVSGGDSYAKVDFIGGPTIELSDNTDVTVKSSGAIARLALASGSISFSTNGRSVLHIAVEPYEVSGETASGRVFVLGDKTVGIRVRTGSLMVRNTDSKESFLLTEGQERLLGRANGVVADPISMIASNLADPLPAGMPPAPAPQASSMSSSAWIAIIAAVAGGAAAGSWFLARRDQADLDAANAAIVGLENTNAGLSATIVSLNNDVASLTNDIGSLTSDIADLNNQLTILENQRSGLQAERSALETELITLRH